MKRTGGRRRVDPDDDSCTVTLTLPARRFDQLAAEAERDKVSVPEVIRRRLRSRRRDDDTAK